ncbi:glutathione S-transferase family protein [Pelomonas sp. P8]|uniref:Glutathione S-transferase family protein n=2 Tax=Pelomonas cellulosilytica TaxID=2906762 RepID=A0ABS8XZN3_9BURK|nr:glutathione S-transferase family protein [Pelomonas sp. P8]MCE4556153.1 glutathione S-transferase family protein [Pelomonas sp. P8]
MSLTLYSHPLSSYCWKVLIALYENGTPFEARLVNLGDPTERAAYAALWPTAKIPLLVDSERIVPETSVQIEYLDHHHPGAVRLLPDDFESRLHVRLWDRLFDDYVMDPMQRYIAQLLRTEGLRDTLGMQQFVEALGKAYDLIESRMGQHAWAAGDSFSMADCAAAPSLFYAATIRPFEPEHVRLAAYFERLIARPSVWRVITEARPVFPYYPLRQAVPDRFLSEG